MTLHERRRGAGCPETDALLGPLSADLKEHLAHCPYCRAELELRRSFEDPLPGNAERADLDWLEARMRETRPGLPPARKWWHLPLVPRFALASALAVTLLAVAVQWNSRQVSPLDETGTTGPVLRSAGQLEWIGAPAGELAQLPAKLEWTARPGASYVVELVEVDGAVAWKSDPLREPSLAIPAEVRGIAGSRRTLFWRVKAVDAAGRVVAESERLSFRVAPTAGQ